MRLRIYHQRIWCSIDKICMHLALCCSPCPIFHRGYVARKQRAYLIMKVKAEGNAGMEGRLRLCCGIDISHLSGPHPALLMIQHSIDPTIANGLAYDALCVLDAGKAWRPYAMSSAKLWPLLLKVVLTMLAGEPGVTNSSPCQQPFPSNLLIKENEILLGPSQPNSSVA